MDDDELARIAAQVSLLMQVDRLHDAPGKEVDADVLANVPDYIASVFERINAVDQSLTPNQVYGLMNKRFSQLQAQMYLLRLEMNQRGPLDPADLLADPQAVSLYGERLDEATKVPKSFQFDPSIVAHGWHPTEIDETGAHRWMCRGNVSVACLPHLGRIDQIIEIHGNYVSEEQIGNLTISVGPVDAEIFKVQANPRHFIARITVPSSTVESANYLPVAFRMTDFRQPNEYDTRELGANISSFTCRPATQRPPRVEEDKPAFEEDPELADDYDADIGPEIEEDGVF